MIDQNVERFQTGSLVRSKAGHDKDEIFVITGQSGEYAEIADGKGRTVQRPKRKKKKHLQPIGYLDSTLAQKLRENKPFLNEDIKFAIKMYRRS